MDIIIHSFPQNSYKVKLKKFEFKVIDCDAQEKFPKTTELRLLPKSAKFTAQGFTPFASQYLLLTAWQRSLTCSIDKE